MRLKGPCRKEKTLPWPISGSDSRVVAIARAVYVSPWQHARHERVNGQQTTNEYTDQRVVQQLCRGRRTMRLQRSIE